MAYPRVAGALVQFTTDQAAEFSSTIYRWVPFNPLTWTWDEIYVLYRYELQKLNNLQRLRRCNCQLRRLGYQGCFGLTQTIELAIDFLAGGYPIPGGVRRNLRLCRRQLSHWWTLFCILCLKYVETLDLPAEVARLMLPKRARAQYERQDGDLWRGLPRITDCTYPPDIDPYASGQGDEAEDTEYEDEHEDEPENGDESEHDDDPGQGGAHSSMPMDSAMNRTTMAH